MINSLFDIIILWAWAAWLFCATNIDNKYKTLIIEWANTPANKLLLSAKWRWNITNKNISPLDDYVTNDKYFLESAFKKYWVSRFLEYLNQEWIETKEEDFWRILLASNKVAHFKDYLLTEIESKWTQILYNTYVEKVCKVDNFFEIITKDMNFYAKNIVIATGWPSFPKLWASDIAIKIAKDFWLKTTPFYPALAWFETHQDFSSLSGSSVICDLSLIYYNNTIFKQHWPILFTHRWLSGPSIFNASLFMRESWPYKLNIKINKEDITKRLLAFLWFHNNELQSYQFSADIKNVRWLNEAKVCWWWVNTTNLKSNFECKDIPGLYFIWECLDVTWKTGGFNLQRCWTSWFICANNFNNA